MIHPVSSIFILPPPSPEMLEHMAGYHSILPCILSFPVVYSRK